MSKKIIAFLCMALVTFSLGACGNSAPSEPEKTTSTSSTTDESTDGANEDADGDVDASKDEGTSSEDLMTGTHHVEIEVENYGTIALELDADTAPISVTNFVNLASSGFYDGLTFHRIISGFMIQGGDPLGNGTGGSDTTIKGEFLANGVENNISHVRGTISMARATPPDSASSQFFIVHEDSEFLDGQYAGFGHVTSGMEVVDAICENTPVVDDNGTVLADDQPVITSVKVID